MDDLADHKHNITRFLVMEGYLRFCCILLICLRFIQCMIIVAGGLMCTARIFSLLEHNSRKTTKVVPVKILRLFLVEMKRFVIHSILINTTSWLPWEMSSEREGMDCPKLEVSGWILPVEKKKLKIYILLLSSYHWWNPTQNYKAWKNLWDCSEVMVKLLKFISIS